MTWSEVGSWTITEYQTWLPVSFTSRLIMTVTDIAGLKPTWNWSGFFYQYLDISPVGLTRIDKKINLPTIDPILFIPQVFQPNYQLKFIKADWIPSLILTIYEDSMPLNYYPDLGTVPNPFASTTNSTAVPVSATSVSLLAANPNRKKLMITNNSNQDLHVDFDATATVADYTIKIPKIPANGIPATYELEAYTGVVSGIWAAAGTGAALVKEMVA